MKCPKCNHENPSILQYCEKCGEKLPLDKYDIKAKSKINTDTNMVEYYYTKTKDIIALISGFFILMGVLSPWIEIGILSKNGLSTIDGVILFIFSILIIIISIVNMSRYESTPIFYGIIGVISLGIGLWDLHIIKSRAMEVAHRIHNLQTLLKTSIGEKIDSSQFIGIGVQTVVIGASLLVLTILLKSVREKKIK